MKKQKKLVRRNKIALKGGSYSLIVSTVLLAVLVAVNVLMSALPSTYTSFDISSAKLYSITSNTKAIVNALDQDVTIYWIVQSEQENSVLENLLDKYDSLSDHIEVVKKNPDVYPTFAAQYTDEDVSNNSLVVECGDTSRYIPYSDIYVTETDMTTYSQTTSFDGESAVTSAIDYVTKEDHPQLYLLQGHGESDLPDELADQIEKANIETQTFSLLNEDEIPDDADCILIYAPTSDISDEEKTLLSDYTADGGKLMVVSGLVEDGTLTNLNSILNDYDVEVQEGVVVEGDRDHYAFQMPYILLPDIASDTITSPLVDGNYYVIMPIAQGLTVNDTTGAVTSLLTTSDDSFCKADGYNITTYEKEDGDTDGPFALAVSIACDGGGQIVWFASSDFMAETYNAYSSGANVDLGMNALSALIGEEETVSIRSKSLSYSYLTITETTASNMKLLMIGVIPVACLCIGIAVILRRRSRQHETIQ